MSDETAKDFFQFHNARPVRLYCAVCKIELARQPRWEILLRRGEIGDAVRGDPCGHIIAFRRSGAIRRTDEPT